MGDKAQYEGKTRQELEDEARRRGVTVAANADEEQLREALLKDDKQKSGAR